MREGTPLWTRVKRFFQKSRGWCASKKLAHGGWRRLTVVYHGKVLAHPMLEKIWLIVAVYWGICALLIFLASQVLP
jgi:hypothetical protein